MVLNGMQRYSTVLHSTAAAGGRPHNVRSAAHVLYTVPGRAQALNGTDW
jgi:hypothetical protein